MTTRWIFHFLLLPLTIFLVACQPEPEPPVSASSVVAKDPVAVAMPDDPDPALWVIKDEDTTIYLFGTVHILKPGLTWFDEAVKEAFDASDELVVEMVDPDPAKMMKIVNDLAIDKSGVSLRDKLNEEDRASYEAALASLDVPVAAFDPLDPWFASVSLSLIPLVQNGYDAGSGVEKDLTALAKLREMTINGLETPEQQLGFFDNLPQDVQIRFLNFTVDSLGETAKAMEMMVAHWALGNIDQLAEMMNAGLEDKVLYDTLLVKRNANWAEWVEQRMDKPGVVFMAVGAGHLAGESSLQELLAKKGLASQRIEY